MLPHLNIRAALKKLRGAGPFVKEMRARHHSQAWKLLVLQSELKAGVWRAEDGIFWQNRADRDRVYQLFFLLYRRKQLESTSWNSRARRWLETLFALRFRVRNNVRQGPSVAFFSRTTLITRDISEKLNRARTLPLFQVFSTNDFTIEDRLGPTHDLCVKREALIDTRCVGNLPPSDQLGAMKAICGSYVKYATLHSHPPQPELFGQFVDEVAHCLLPNDRANCLAMKNAYMDFVAVARTVPAHLDFNVGNFLTGDDPMLLDIEDAGLWLPASYDMNNLLLNEVYLGRETHLLQAVLRDPFATGYDKLLQVTTGQNAITNIRLSLFANFILRESRYVSSELLQTWDEQQVQRSWDKFTTTILDWPFVKHDL